MCNLIDRDSALDAVSRFLSESQFDVDLQAEHQAGAGAVRELEETLKRHYEKKYALCFSNATTALQAVAMACNLGRDAEVIMSPITWGGSVSAILLHGCRVVFAPVDRDSLCIDCNDLEKAATKGTKAVISVDYGGMAADSQRLKSFAEERGLVYISDSSPSLGAYRDGKAAGHFADVIVTSFTAGKPIFAGEGGAIVTSKQEIYERLLWISQHPARQKKELGLFRYNPYAPLNGRMNPVSAIWINERFDQSLIDLRRKQEQFHAMLDSLVRDEWIRSNAMRSSSTCSTFHNCFVDPCKGKRSDLIKHINERGWNFSAREAKLTFIPEDPVFVKQFRGRFRVVGKRSPLWVRVSINLKGMRQVVA